MANVNKELEKFYLDALNFPGQAFKITIYLYPLSIIA